MNKFKKIENIAAYSGEKRFFVSIQKSDGTEEILTDAALDPNDPIAVQRSILLRKNLNIIGDIRLGKRRELINDPSGNILHSKLAIENETNNGKLIGFKENKCQTIQPTSSIFLSPSTPLKIKINDINLNVELFLSSHTNESSWQFAFPSNINYNDDLYMQLYFCKDVSNEKIQNKFLEFEYNLSPLNNNSNTINFNKQIIELNDDVFFNTNNIKCKIQKQKDEVLNNKLFNLILKRNINETSIDNYNRNIFLVGIKLEFKLNYFT